MTQDSRTNGPWIMRNVQMERQAHEFKWNCEHHFSSSLEDEVFEFASAAKSLFLAHHLQTVSTT